MPSARGNQPNSTGSNHNQSKYATSKPPKRNKKAPMRKPPKRLQKHKMDNQQSKLINKLSKQVYKLQMATYGSVQQNFHSTNREIIPTASYPACVDLTDFTSQRRIAGQVVSNGCRVWQATQGPPGYAAVSYWQPSTAVQNNLYWKAQNQDAPDTGKYLAMSATYFIDVEGLPNLDNTRVRFDVIAQKADANIPQVLVGGSPDIPRVLPFTLGELSNLAEPHLNRINPVYFHKYFSKTLFFNSSKTNQNTKGTTGNIQRFSFKIRPNKIMQQKESNPLINNVPVVNVDTGDIELQDEESHGNFGPLNVSPNQPLWLVISTDDQTAITGDQVVVRMSRRVVYRDHVGSANL